jgi:hypothetical protein
MLWYLSHEACQIEIDFVENTENSWLFLRTVGGLKIAVNSERLEILTSYFGMLIRDGSMQRNPQYIEVCASLMMYIQSIRIQYTVI